MTLVNLVFLLSGIGIGVSLTIFVISLAMRP